MHTLLVGLLIAALVILAAIVIVTGYTLIYIASTDIDERKDRAAMPEEHRTNHLPKRRKTFRYRRDLLTPSAPQRRLSSSPDK